MRGGSAHRASGDPRGDDPRGGDPGGGDTRDGAPAERGPTGPGILAMIAPACIWALHFIVLYALISAACAPRMLISPEAAQLWGFVATALAVPAALAPILRARWADALGRATLALVLFSTVAILADATVFLVFDSCGG